MKNLMSITLLSLSMMAGAPALADSHCACDKECAAKCEKGPNADCKCKTCDCAQGKGCKHGKCNHKKD